MNKARKPQYPRSGYAITSLILSFFSFFPLIGVILGIAAIVFGAIALYKLKRDKNSGKRMAITGIILSIFGILFTFILYGSLFYFGFVAKGGPFAEVKVEASKMILTQNAGYLELYKKSHGSYPKKLEDLSKKGYAAFPSDHYLKPLFYKVSDDGRSYELRSLGPDGIFNTPDDIYPSK